MKTLYLIGGPMGVGKTAVSETLKRRLKNAVFLDGDNCWDADPFQVTDETKEMVLDNICHLLNNFLRCSAYENVLFCWVMHEQGIIDDILSHLDTRSCTIKCISLIADPETIQRRLMGDIARGLRTEDVIARSMERLTHYPALNTIKINTDGKTVEQVADELERL